MSTKQGSLSLQASVRLRGGVLILKGYDNEEIADILEVSPRSVQNWRRKLRAHGDDLTCLVRRKGSGRPPTLTDEQKQQLKQIILDGAMKLGYADERWTSKIIADMIQQTFDVSLAPRTVRQILPTLGLSPQKPVMKSHKHSDEEVLRWAQHTWKKRKKKRRDSAFL
jgi:transposase